MNQLKILLCILFFTLIQNNLYAISNDNIDALSKEFMQNNKVQGMSIAVIHNDKVSFYNYGYANELKKIPTTDNTIYRINSFTKTFTATLAGVAQVEGKIKLDEPFITYFPQVKENKEINNITSAQLLAHIASMPGIFQEPYTSEPPQFDDLSAMLKHYKPSVPVGTEYSYSNYSIGIMAYVLQNATKKSYEELLNKNIIQPLHLKSTYLNIPKNKLYLEALGHDEKNKIIPISNKIPVLFAAGALKSTITDMAKYLSAQINHTHIEDKDLKDGISLVHNFKFCFEKSLTCEQLAWQEHALQDLNKSASETLGPYKISKNKEKPFLNVTSFVDKTGGGGGMSSYMAYINKEQKGVVILINKNLGDERIKLGRDILRNL